MAVSRLITRNEYWSRCLLGTKIHLTNALRDLLHNACFLPINPQLHTCLTQFKQNASPRVVKIISAETWDKLCHQCTNLCQSPCKKKGVTRINDLDITALAFIYRNLEKIIVNPNPGTVHFIIPIKKQLKNIVERACDVRNSLMHGVSDMKREEFKSKWKEIRQNLVAMKYPPSKIKMFDELESCSLDPYQKLEIDCLTDTCEWLNCQYNDLKAKQQNDQVEMSSELISLQDDFKNIEQRLTAMEGRKQGK